MGKSRSSKAKSGAGAGAGAGSGKSSGGDGYDSSSSDSSGTWGEGGATTGQPNWLLLSVIVNLLLVGACVETYVTRMSVGEVVERLESVIDVQLEKKVCEGGATVPRTAAVGAPHVPASVRPLEAH